MGEGSHAHCLGDIVGHMGHEVTSAVAEVSLGMDRLGTNRASLFAYAVALHGHSSESLASPSAHLCW